MLDWYIHGISELPLGRRLLLLVADESISPLLSFSVLCACVCPEGTVVVFVARRRVRLETRERHEWALPGLLVWGEA